jgi:hypothetical protein
MLHYLYPLNEAFTIRTTTKKNLHQNGKSPAGKVIQDGQYFHISQQKVIVSHVICEIICNMKKFAH